MCIRDRVLAVGIGRRQVAHDAGGGHARQFVRCRVGRGRDAVSYTHLRAHETVLDLVCRLLLEKKKTKHTLYHRTHYHSMKD